MMRESRNTPSREAKTRAVAGTHAIRELLLQRPKSVRSAWFTLTWESNADLREIAKTLQSHKIKIEVKPEAQLEKACRSHQGLVVQADPLPEFDLNELRDCEQAVVLVLDGVEDPHNLGALLRTAWLLGVKALLIPQDRAVGLTGTVHKVASGGVEHVPVIACNQFGPSLEMLKEMGFWVFGLSHRSKKSIHNWKAPEKVVWCLGAEDKGLRTTTEKLCDELISLPQLSAAASFNVSVAGAMALSETFRQFPRKTPTNSKTQSSP